VATTDAAQSNVVIVPARALAGGSGKAIEALCIDTKKMARDMTEQHGGSGVFVPGGMNVRVKDTTGGLYGVRVAGMHSMGAKSRSEDAATIAGIANAFRYNPSACESTHFATFDHVIGCGAHPATEDGVDYAFNTQGTGAQLSSEAARHLLVWNGMSPKKLLDESPVQTTLHPNGDELGRKRIVSMMIRDPKIAPESLEDGAEHPMINNPLASIIHRNHGMFPEDKMPQIHTDQDGVQFIHVDDHELGGIVGNIQAQAVEVRGMKPTARIFVTPLHDGPPPNPNGHLLITAGINGSVCTPTIRTHDLE
jgi:hypothetical protein